MKKLKMMKLIDRIRLSEPESGLQDLHLEAKEYSALVRKVVKDLPPVFLVEKMSWGQQTA